MIIYPSFLNDLKNKVRQKNVKSADDLSDVWKKELLMHAIKNLDFDQIKNHAYVNTDKINIFLNRKIREIQNTDYHTLNYHKGITEPQIMEQLDLL